MFYRIKNDKLFDYADYKYADDCLETNIINQAELDAHKNKVIVQGGILVLNPDYEQEQTAAREADFKSKFFNIEGFGWYRKQPKGYQSAVESMNVLFNIANVTDGIQAGLIIFYEQPDFTKPEECTEDWLIEHQNIQGAMTKAEFMQLYVAFMMAWNTEEHE